VRLFVALELPEQVRMALNDLIARLKLECPKARWVRPEGMHITLKFIGEADASKLDAIGAALATVHSSAPMEMDLRGVGFFPNERRPRAAWCGVEASPNLAQLAADIARALEPLGFPAESRQFVPHLTLARFKSPDGLEKLVSAAGNLKSQGFGSVRESEFHLFQSFLKPSGSEYKRLATFPFAAAVDEKSLGKSAGESA
jgi:RNA 2',3'-cyclic 3'-phosphodiesterase